MKHIATITNVLLVASCVAANPPHEQILDATDRAYLRKALAAIRMTPHDLGFKKDLAPSDLVHPCLLYTS
ncbi:MAG: hypothetical protein N3A53_06345, partial [Verrucomicrobiae bacterium]|nr:hypothetical protein [Verrucomicrobiae bacterium]